MTSRKSDDKPDEKSGAKSGTDGDTGGETNPDPHAAPTEVTGARDDDQAPTEITAADEDAPTTLSDGGSAATEVTDNGTAAGRSGERAANPLAGIRPGYVLKDRFRLEEKLGSGAMGAVFRAVDQRRVETQHHNPNVAIKLIAGEFSKHAKAFIALQREADKSQTLAHPNVITVYDFDRDGDLFFMTMESLVGDTLDKYIAAGKGTRKQTLGYIEDIANGIAYAHRRNIVHSDLKPQNIFITEEGQLKVLDFGIARAVSAMDEDGPANKDPGEVAGLTPTYASCEMLEGADPQPSDDVYAIGLIAYEMLTGDHPFARKKATEARDEGLKPRRIKGLPGYQWQAIAKALAFERGDRWQNAEQFRRKFSGTGRRVRQLSVALLVAVLAFGGYMMFYQPESGPDIPFEELPPEKQQAFNQALEEGRKARRFGDLNGALFYFDKAYTTHPRNPRVMEEIDGLLEEVLARMEEATDGDPEKMLTQIEELQKYESLDQNPRLTAKRKALEQRAE